MSSSITEAKLARLEGSYVAVREEERRTRDGREKPERDRVQTVDLTRM